MKEKIYLDAIELAEREIFSVIIDEDYEVILAGTTINSMEVVFKKDYQNYADYYDVHFIFDDAIPKVKFYTVPRVDIVATDSLGGFIGSIGQTFDIDSDVPICYINKDLETFIIAEKGSTFLRNIETWKKDLKPYEKITFYRSRTDAESKLAFIDLPKGPIGEKLK